MAKTKNSELNEILRITDRLLLNDYKYGSEKEVLLEEELNEARPLGHPPGYPDEKTIRASLAQLKQRDAEALLDRMPGEEGEYPSIRQPEMDETMDEMHSDEMGAGHWDCPECGCEDNTSSDCPHCGHKYSSEMEEMIADEDVYESKVDEGAAHYEDLYNKFLAEETDEEDDDSDDDSDEVDEDDSDDSDDSGKKTNGHKADCECPLCKNLKEATDENNINAPKNHKTGTPLETDAGDNKANKNKANMGRKGGKRALNPSNVGKAVLAKGTVNAVSESELNEFAKSDEAEDTASKNMSQDEMSQLRWMLNLLGKTKEYSYARRVYEKARSGQAITVPQEKKILREMIELYMQADKGALRIFLNRLK